MKGSSADDAGRNDAVMNEDASFSDDNSIDNGFTKEEAEKEIRRQVKRCISNLMILANGVKAENPKDGSGRADYDVPPNRAANEYILNRVLGRPPSLRPPVENRMAGAPRVDLSNVPLERMKIMERWLIEANVDIEGRGDGAGGSSDI
jgi:hypothetical protein